ncbi:MAG: hypothetical protein RLZZ24_1283 [Pseudomonadota bacterium]
MTRLLLGCIADDFTGATDLANNLVRAGMRVVQTIGTPTAALQSEVDAVVIALKSRTEPVADAVSQSLHALQWLRDQGAKQIYFKYCSTFDSTSEGNIGPVTEALMQALQTDFTIATPAFPDNGRTVFKGHLFVGDVLLNESGMQHHPLTPMTDANLVRVMQAQCRAPVGLIDFKTIAHGEAAIRQRMTELKAQGVRIAIVDALSNDDLMRLGPALRDLPLVTAGSGVAIALPHNFGLRPTPRASALPPPHGHRAIVAGSCSQATQKQVADFRARGGAALEIDTRELVGENTQWAQAVQHALTWARPLLTQGPVLIYSTAQPEAVKALQAQFGVAQTGQAIETALAAVAVGLQQLGVGQLIVAGGETSGACVKALGIAQMQIGLQIDPGVPWCHAHTPAGELHVALKSGNFGSDDFFSKAFVQLAQAVTR